MESLAQDSRFFTQVHQPSPSSRFFSLNPCETREDIARAVDSLLGENFCSSTNEVWHPSAYERQARSDIFSVLSELLFPDCSSSDSTVHFFWQTFATSLSSMLEIAHYPRPAIIQFLVFLYARILGMLGPSTKTQNKMTADGSPAASSWVIPNRSKPESGDVNRQIRFAIQPMDPRTGHFLQPGEVLRYLTSAEGGLGLVYCPEGGLDWCERVDRFYHGDTPSRDAGSLFYLGFGLMSSGHIALKAYFQPPLHVPSFSASVRGNDENLQLSSPPCPLFVGSKDFSHLRGLVADLYDGMDESLSLLLDYFDSLDEPLKPWFHMLAVDVTGPLANRLKIYVGTRVGLSFNDVRRCFTLDGRLHGSDMNESLARLRVLWDCLFPDSHSQSGLDVQVPTIGSSASASLSSQPSTNPGRGVTDQHPTAGLGYYYELGPGIRTVCPKIYIPVRQYCRSDAFTCSALESFYADKLAGIGKRPSGWLARDVEAAFSHRPLSSRSGICTWVTFGHKNQKGWEVMSYFSPEIWAQS